MNYPAPLQKGMTIAFIAPSGALRNAEVLPRTVNFWKRQGFQAVIRESCTARHGYLAGDDALRAADINRFFADDSVDAIFCVRGGYGAARLMKLLNFELIRRKPKIFVGFSDITALHGALNRYGQLATFHGPNGDITVDDDKTPASLSSLLQALESPDGYEILNPPGFPRTTLAPGIARGEIVGGNLTVLAHSLGTPWQPDFAGKLLFLEDVNEYTYRVDETLMNLMHAGAFDACAGVLLGEFTDCTAADPTYALTLDEIFSELLLPLGKPVLGGIRAGHCNPKITIPLGVAAEMDVGRQTLRLLRGAVEPR